MLSIRRAGVTAAAVVIGIGSLAACGANDAETESGDGAKKIALLLPESKTTRYETFDRPLFEEAIKAVPQGAERANIDQETLGKPLQDFAVYEPCKPGTAKVKMNIAVWDGKAVGIDVATTPKNEKLAGCIKDRIKGLTWQAKVKSLNTVEYSF